MYNTTAFALTGFRVTKELGTVRGVVVRSRSVVGNIGASIQTLFGGDTEVLCYGTAVVVVPQNDASG